MNGLQAALAAGALVLAATTTEAAPGTAAAGIVGSGGGAQSQEQRALAAREGFLSPQSNGDPGLLEYSRPMRDLSPFPAAKLRAFREEVLRRQQEDGGTLSESDRAYLHAKLDRILVP